MYKITMFGKTMVGTNFDAYYQTSRIWFENRNGVGNYGAVFSGGRFDGNNGFAPQSGMNEYGLAFSRLAAPDSEKKISVALNKKVITNPTNYLKDILHKCKNIDEVQDYINLYDQTYFNGDVFIYIDKSGKYLVVEPDTMIVGYETKYVLSNFCPTVTKEVDALKMAKYRNGIEFLKNGLDTTIEFCTALSDTMHVCRKKIGDGTLLTSIFDLNDGIIYYYFYHDYKHRIKFNLSEELAKGDHILEVPKLFPPNKEYEKLINYKIPPNNKALQVFLFFCSGVFLLSSLIFVTSFFRKRKSARYSYIKMILFFLGIILSYYMLVLIKKENIFYFPAPYQDYKFSMLNVAAYIPFLILFLIIPLLIVNRKVYKEKVWSIIAILFYTLNNFLYLILIILFFYWGFYDIL
jgi:hypothetical protein